MDKPNYNWPAQILNELAVQSLDQRKKTVDGAICIVEALEVLMHQFGCEKALRFDAAYDVSLLPASKQVCSVACQIVALIVMGMEDEESRVHLYTKAKHAFVFLGLFQLLGGPSTFKAECDTLSECSWRLDTMFNAKCDVSGINAGLHNPARKEVLPHG